MASDQGGTGAADEGPVNQPGYVVMYGLPQDLELNQLMGLHPGRAEQPGLDPASCPAPAATPDRSRQCMIGAAAAGLCGAVTGAAIGPLVAVASLRAAGFRSSGTEAPGSFAEALGNLAAGDSLHRRWFAWLQHAGSVGLAGACVTASLYGMLFFGAALFLGYSLGHTWVLIAESNEKRQPELPAPDAGQGTEAWFDGLQAGVFVVLVKVVLVLAVVIVVHAGLPDIAKASLDLVRPRVQW